MMERFKSLALDERGNSFIEMAFIVPILTTLFVGMVDISRAVSMDLQLEQATQHTIEQIQAIGTQYKTTNNSTYQADAAAAAGVNTSNVTVSSWLECSNDGVKLNYDSGTCSSGTAPFARYVTVSVQKNFTPLFGTRFFPGANSDGTFTLRSTAGVRIQ
jgi:Flp pilus assembly protein TadG